MNPTLRTKELAQHVMDITYTYTIRAGQQVSRWREHTTTTVPTTHRAAFVWGMCAALSAVCSDALAQTTEVPKNESVVENNSPFTTVSKGICTITGWMRGPVGIGLVLLSIIVAGISLAVGGKKSTSTLIAALGGAAVILGARSIMALAAGKSGDGICPATSANAQ